MPIGGIFERRLLFQWQAKGVPALGLDFKIRTKCGGTRLRTGGRQLSTSASPGMDRSP